MSGRETLLRVAARWRRRRLVAAACWGLALGLPLAAAAATLSLSLTARLFAAVAALLLPPLAALVAARREAEGAAAVAAHLDRRVPELADSAGLLLADAPLPPLQELQRRRTEQGLAREAERGLLAHLPARPLRGAALAAGAGLALAAALLLQGAPRAAAGTGGPLAPAAPATSPPPPTPLLRRLEVIVTPPAYTGRRARRGDALSVRAEEGSTLTWRVEAAPEVTSASLLLDESDRLSLRADAVAGAFVAARAVREPHLVRLVLDGEAGELWRSPPARVEVVPDRPPAIELLAPATLVERPPQAPGAVTIELAISDDHGVRGASLLATLATGTDELVEFRDQTMPLAARPQARRQVVRRTIDLAALGLAAGAELYLRAEVRDNRRPQANVERSPTVVVRLPIERTESSDLAAGIPMLVGPELLRSQRQIVVDTERLLAEAPRLAAAEVARRSRSLALDQRAVRMRYGILLGDEFVEGRAVEAEEDHGGFEEQGGDSIAALPGAEVHLHDSAESATYFPEPVRQKLKAMLAAMWDAEGQLAVDVPRIALPHERRALELLKQVQQASRVYVQKAGVEGAPLDPTRRLGGELEGVRDVPGRPARPAPAPVAAAALRTLQGLADASGGSVPPADTPALDAQALATLRPALAARAREGDEAALAALPALDELAAGRALDDGARRALLRSLWSLLPAPENPTRPAEPGGRLWQRYRRQRAEGG